METALRIGSSTGQQVNRYGNNDVWDRSADSEAVRICEGKHCRVILTSADLFQREQVRNVIKVNTITKGHIFSMFLNPVLSMLNVQHHVSDMAKFLKVICSAPQSTIACRTPRTKTR